MIHPDWWDRISAFLIKPSHAPCSASIKALFCPLLPEAKKEVTQRACGPKSPHSPCGSRHSHWLFCPEAKEPTRWGLEGQGVGGGFLSQACISIVLLLACAGICSLSFPRAMFHWLSFGLRKMFLCLPPCSSPPVFLTCFSADTGTLVLLLFETPCN